jgi:chromosome segregation ATPase
MIDRDLDEAEEQHQMALRNHLIHVDELIALQNSRLRGLHEEFERDLSIIKAEFDREKHEIENSHHMERQELRDMIETIDEEENSKLKKMKDDFESLREETKNKNVEELESMKHDLIKKIEDLDKEFEVNFNRYVSETETKAEYYKKLLEDNEKSSQQINNYQRQINRLKEQIAYWSLKMKQTERECQERNQKLRKEKEMIVKHYHDLKKKMI